MTDVGDSGILYPSGAVPESSPSTAGADAGDWSSGMAEETARAEVREWQEKHKDDPDVQAAVRDLEEGESTYQGGEKVGKQTVYSIHGIASLLEGAEGVDQVLAMRDAVVPWADPSDSPRRRVEQLLWRARFDYLLQQMSVQRGLLLIEALYLGKSPGLIAAERHVNERTVRRRLEVAIGEFRRLLVERADELEAIGVEDV